MYADSLKSLKFNESEYEGFDFLFKIAKEILYKIVTTKCANIDIKHHVTDTDKEIYAMEYELLLLSIECIQMGIDPIATEMNLNFKILKAINTKTLPNSKIMNMLIIKSLTEVIRSVDILQFNLIMQNYCSDIVSVEIRDCLEKYENWKQNL